MEAGDDRRILARMVRQKLEALGRAGLELIPGSSDLIAKPPAPAVKRTVARAEDAKSTVSPAIEVPAVKPTAAPAVRPSIPLPIATSLFEVAEPQVIVPVSERAGQLSLLEAEVAKCIRCPHLASTRKRTVFGEGPTNPRLMLIGEAPGADEDASGRPFVGRAGMLLTDMITKGMGLAREEVYIANILKSRPPDNRTPLPDEMANCLPYLEQQIAILRPEFLCLLGKTAASALLETALPLGKLRGKWYRYRGIATIVTYHPSALLRNPDWKRDAWSDLQLLMNAMGLKTPEKKRPG